MSPVVYSLLLFARTHDKYKIEMGQNPKAKQNGPNTGPGGQNSDLEPTLSLPLLLYCLYVSLSSSRFREVKSPQDAIFVLTTKLNRSWLNEFK